MDEELICWCVMATRAACVRMTAVGPTADGVINSSRGRLLALMRAGDADGAAAEMEHHLRGLRLMARLPGMAEPGEIAV
jgi:hypothetical protein